MSKGRILIIDDEEDFGKTLEIRLRRNGYVSEWAQNDLSALEVVRKQDFDLILLDYHLKGSIVDGRELRREITGIRPSVETAYFCVDPEWRDEEMPEEVHLCVKDGQTDWDAFDLAVLEGVNRGLQRRAQWYRSMLDSSTEMGMMILNENGRILWASHLEDEVFETPLEGRLLNEAIAERKVEGESKTFEDLSAEPEKPVRWKFGENLWREVRFLKNEHDGGYGLLVSLDRSKPIKMNQLIKEVQEEESFQGITWRICKAMTELGYPRVRLWVLRGDGHTLRLVASDGYLPDAVKTDPTLVDYPIDIDPRIRELLSGKNGARIFRKEEYHNNAQMLHLMDSIGGGSIRTEWLEIPLVVKDEIVGFITLDMLRGDSEEDLAVCRALSVRDETLCDTFGHFVAAALSRSMSLWRLNAADKVEKKWTTKIEVDIDELLEDVFKEAMNAPWLLDWWGIDITLRKEEDPRDHIYTRVYASPECKDFFPPEEDVSQGLTGEIRGRNPENIRVYGFQDIRKEPAFIKYCELLAQRPENARYLEYLQKCVSKLLIPLVDIRGDLLGFLCLHHNKMIQITASHERWLVNLATKCARMLEIREKLKYKERLERQLQDRLMHVKMHADLGHFLGGVAHEVKHYLQLMVAKKPKLERLIQHGEKEQAASRLDEIFLHVNETVTRMETLRRIFGGTGEGISILDMNKLTKNAVGLARIRGEESGATTSVFLDSNRPNVRWNRDEARLAMTNLLMNAYDAVKEAGDSKKITVRTEDVPGKRSVRISIEDTGPGIREEHRDRIFEFGFTTKTEEANRGLGMGLSMVKSTVDRANGAIWFETRPGKGTVFYIDLPWCEEEIENGKA